MLTNPRADRVKSVRALSRRSVRDRSGRFVADGPQSVREAVRYAPDLVDDLYVAPGAADRYAGIVADARAAGIHVHEAADEVLLAMSETDAPQGLLAVCRRAEPSLAGLLATGPRLLVLLTNVRDPGNAGTVIRAADAAGADGVLVSESSVDVTSAKVVRSTAGSIFHLPIVTGLAVGATLGALRTHGIRTLAAAGDGPSDLRTVPLDTPHAWVMGNEAWGLPAEVAAACDDIVSIPIHGRAESLNLAMAATICLYTSAGVVRR